MNDPYYIVQYRKPEKCNTSECVEVAKLPNGNVQLRDKRGITISYTRAEWDVFHRALRSNEFDDLLA